LAAEDFLGGQNSTAKEIVVFLAVLANNQEMYISWRVERTAKKSSYFLGC